ncbi:MAG: hypothetical protein LIP28_07580 [Deltaproteobacteria bacterium]|nr:hypothetical protein [Deltaproteobacteria bacterium]
MDNVKRDNKYFNCGEDHEIRHVAGQYRDPEEVAAYIRQECVSGHIHYWTHEKVYALLDKKGFKKKS